ncbi:MAG: glycosyltransferase family 4 protein [Anaerolineae bacterium]|nr:glycosyltransferase family 4 protein [Anaerolineae bacterium]
MRIVMVGPFGLRPKGTMNVRALPLAKALAARGHKIDIILPSWHLPEDSGKSWEEEGVGIRNVPLPPRLPGVWHLWVAGRMLRQVLALNPDVVHCFKPKAYSGIVALNLWGLQRLGVFTGRIVVDSDDWEGKGGWNEIEGYSAFQRIVFAWQERWGLIHANAITVASRALETLTWGLGVSPSAVHYLPNGSASGKLEEGDGGWVRDKYGLEGRPVILLYTRFFEFSIERLIEIMRRVVTQVPTVRLLVVGRGLFGEEERFLDLARAAHIGSAVIYAGWVEHKDLADYFAASDVAIYPYDDTLINRTKCSVKLIELLAAGLPVVADRVGQNREYIKDGVSGILVENRMDTYADAVVRLLSDAELRSRLGVAAQKSVWSDYNWGRLAAVAERAYGE